jgi:hypothetical protein
LSTANIAIAAIRHTSPTRQNVRILRNARSIQSCAHPGDGFGARTIAQRQVFCPRKDESFQGGGAEKKEPGENRRGRLFRFTRKRTRSRPRLWLRINKSPVSHVKDMIFAYNAPSRPEGCDFGDMREGRNATSNFFSPLPIDIARNGQRKIWKSKFLRLDFIEVAEKKFGEKLGKSFFYRPVGAAASRTPYSTSSTSTVLPDRRCAKDASMKASRSPSSTSAGVPETWPVRRSLTIWYGCKTYDLI